MQKQIGSFVAKDSHGNQHTITVSQKFIEAVDQHGEHWGELPGLKSLETDGRPVNRLEKGQYQIVGGVLLTSDDPRAE
jgi:hypothetical protein